MAQDESGSNAIYRFLIFQYDYGFTDGMFRREGLLIDFIGSHKGQHEWDFENERFAYDPDHESHWGKDSELLAENAATMLYGKAPGGAAAGEGDDVSGILDAIRRLNQTITANAETQAMEKSPLVVASDRRFRCIAASRRRHHESQSGLRETDGRGHRAVIGIQHAVRRLCTGVDSA